MVEERRERERERIENNLVINDIRENINVSFDVDLPVSVGVEEKISSINTIISPSWQRRTKNEVSFYQKANQEKKEETQQKRERKRERKNNEAKKDENLSLFVLFPNNSEMETGTMMMMMTKEEKRAREREEKQFCRHE